jgi:hypothetical protein
MGDWVEPDPPVTAGNLPGAFRREILVAAEVTRRIPSPHQPAATRDSPHLSVNLSVNLTDR